MLILMYAPRSLTWHMLASLLIHITFLHCFPVKVWETELLCLIFAHNDICPALLHWKLQVWQIWLPVWASDWRWSKPPIRSYTLVTISSGKHLFWQYRNMWKGATKTVLKPKWVILYSFQKVWQTYICQLPPTTETFSAQDFLAAFVKKIKEGAPCILSSVLGCSRYKFYTTQW